MNPVILAAVELIIVHMVDGRTVAINPQQVTQLVHTREHGNRALVESVKCLIRLTDGGYLSVAETCEAVQKLMEGTKQ